MLRTIENTKFGDVIVRNVVIDIDGTNLEEGVSIIVKGTDTNIELLGYRDVEEMSVETVEEELYKNL